jgi:DNA-binding SARP family transcriptional activator/class 3 adenylate cyclase
MEFRILGPLEVLVDGRPLEVGGPKQRGLLASLLLEANRVVSTDRLVHALWGAGAPDTAQKALHVYVSQLRKLLGRERLQTKPPGYLIQVLPGELDADRFRALYETGDWSEALELWRGPALADFAYEEFAQAAIGSLEELRLVCVEERIDRDLERGRHAELAGELESLIAANPHRERLRAQQMLALYRAGRQAEALEAYQTARNALVDELGIEPSRELRALHQALLNQDEGLDLPAGGEAPASPSPPASIVAVAPRESRKTISVLFVAFPPVEGLDPEALRRNAAAALTVVAAAAERHGGSIEVASTDAATAIFGVPAVHEDDALRAVRAAVELRRPDLKIAVCTGEVLAGGETAGQLRATGEPLPRAARLAHGADAGEVLVDRATHLLVRESVVAEPAEDAWRVVAATNAAAGSSRLASPMVGRVRERRRLHDAFEQALGDRSCQLFTVLGTAGVGKSRLVHEFLADVTGRALVARGRCLPYGEGITYWPLAEAVKEAVGIEDTDAPEDGLPKLVAGLPDEQDATGIARRVADTIGITEAGGSVEERFGAITAFFEGLARSQPLVVVFDDVHWGEPTFLDLVEHLAEWTREAPILLLCLARPELLDVRPGWGGGKLNATATLLEPLSDEECALLIENLVGRAGLIGEVERRIAEAAEGNPLFVEEMLSMLIDEGVLVRRAGGWKATAEIATVRVPPTIQALLTARLDQLGADERTAIECASVVGKVFYESAVAELLPPDARPGVSDALGSLMRKELIRPDRPSLSQRTYRFRHILIRDAAYDSIPKEARTELHERFGRWLEHAAGERSTEYEEVLGYHLEQAYRYREELGSVDEAARAVAREAAERLGSAGRRALVRSDAPAGVNLISRAVALLPPDDPLRVELVPNVRVVQGAGGNLAWADRVLTEAVEAAATSGDRRLAAHALVQRGLLRLFTDTEVTADELLESAERATAVLQELGDDLGLARAWRLKAQAHYLARRGGECAQASERALEHARRVNDPFEEWEIVEWLVIALLLGPAPAAEAAALCRRLVDQTAAQPLLQAQVLSAYAALENMLANTDEANRLMARARSIMNEWGAVGRSFGFSVRGDPVAAEADLRPSYEDYARLGEKRHFNSICVQLAIAVYAQGRYEEAECLTRECEEAARPNDVHSQILWRSTRAKVFAQSGNVDAASALAREAVEFAAASDFHSAHADALVDLAEVLEIAGDRTGAAAAVEQAVELYKLKGNVLAVDRARETLTMLTA